MLCWFLSRPLTDEHGEAAGLLDLLRRGRAAWHKDAACKEAPPDVNWFPDLGQDSRPAKQVCRGCLVMWECRAWSLAQGPDLAGVWGGLSHRERRVIRAGRVA